MQPIIIDRETDLMYRKWHAQNAQAIFLLVHGLGAHTGRWQALAEFFLKQNISSYAIELKGFGDTKGLKGHISSLNIYFRDIASLFDIIKKENPDKKVFLIGESFGALVCFLMAIKEPCLFNGLICISPVFKSKIKFSPVFYLKVFSALICKPSRQFCLPFESNMCTRDVDYQRAMDLDYREHRFASAKLLFNIFLAQISAMVLKNKVKIPLLFLLSGNDLLADYKISEEFFQGLKTADKKIIIYPQMYHALSIDLGKEKVFGDILEWVKGR